jgi:hypothetical protein
MLKFVRSVYTDAQDGLAKQILQISLTEGEGEFFTFQNYELNINVTCKENAAENELNFSKYFESLTNRIQNQKLTQIRFNVVNSFFENDKELGFRICKYNKFSSSPFFSYKLELPKS